MSKPKKDYRDKLLQKGVSAAYINSKRLGKRVSSKEYKRTLKKWKRKKDDFYDELPDELKNNNIFMDLDFDLQEMAFSSYQIQVANNEDKARKMDEAFNMAVKQADPYWKQIIRIAQDETVRTFDEAKGDYQSSMDRINRRQTELTDDVALFKDRLSLDEQVKLGAINRSYTSQIKEVAQNASEAGITFGAGELSRTGQQGLVDEQNEEIVESTKRQFAQQIEDLTIKQQRGDTDAQTQLSDLERTYGSRIQDIGRNIESYLGSQATAGMGIEGYSGMGNITGTMYEDKTKDVEARKRALFDELNQSSLNFDFLTNLR